MTRVGELPYDVDDGFSGGGGCNTFSFAQKEFVMLCFYDGPGKKCIM